MRRTWDPVPVLCLAALAAFACSPGGTAPAIDGDRVAGDWRAVLASPGGALPFGLRIDSGESGLTAIAINGEEEAPFSDVRIEGDELVFDFSWYDSAIRARLGADGDSMVGEWAKRVPEGYSKLAFEATRGGGPRFGPSADAAGTAPLVSVDGAWEVVFTDDGGSEPARGEFRQSGEIVEGTFLTPTGDYRFLAGRYEAGLLRLSTFDGGHAFLFEARAGEDGTLTGDFWSRDTYHATWTARPIGGETVLLPDAWSEVRLTNDRGDFHFAFPDLEGREVTIDDPRFANRVLLVNVFGSWCPNCNDEAPLLAEWHLRYRAAGLEVVGLAYEFTGEVERDREQVRRFAERYGIEYPLLLAGISDKSAAGETLPDLSSVIAYPTTIFIDRTGKVRKIHSGFSGPGTGAHYLELVEEMEELIEELLAEVHA